MPRHTTLMPTNKSNAEFRTGFLFLKAGQTDYIIKNEESTNQYYKTETTADVVDTDTVIPVEDASNMTVGDRIGIYKNDNNLF